MIVCLLCLGLLAGCGRGENPYRVDTVVQIPVNPTEEVQQETTLPTEPAPTERLPAPVVGKPGTAASEPAGTEPAATEVTSPQLSIQEQTVPETRPFAPDASFGHEIIAALNGYRTAAGVGVLIVSDTLGDIAAARAKEASILWTATRPDGRGGVTILDDYDWPYSDAAQFLLHINGADEPSAIAARWAGSADILTGVFTVAGVGFYIADGTTYIACFMTD